MLAKAATAISEEQHSTADYTASQGLAILILLKVSIMAYSMEQEFLIT